MQQKHRVTSMFCVGVALWLATGLAAADEPAAMSVEDQLALFLEWFPGEYDNNEQVWQQRQDGVPEEELHERIHHRFVPVSLPAVGEHVFFVTQALDDDPAQVYRQRIYSFDAQPEESAVRLRIYRMKDEARYREAWRDSSLFEKITLQDLSTQPGCEVYWRHNGQYFDGTMKAGACHFFSTRYGKELYITDTLRLTDSEIWIGDKARDADGNRVFGREAPHVNRKVRRFSGWMGVRKSRVNPDYDGDDMFFVGGFTIHNEGGRQSILDDAGKPTGFGIELARLTYQQTRVPILKLGIIEEATGKTLSYTWASTDASRIGVNLRWFQAGLTAVED